MTTLAPVSASSSCLALGNGSALVAGLGVRSEACGVSRLGNLAGGQLCEGRQDKFGLGHVVAEILVLQSLQVLVPSGGES